MELRERVGSTSSRTTSMCLCGMAINFHQSSHRFSRLQKHFPPVAPCAYVYRLFRCSCFVFVLLASNVRKVEQNLMKRRKDGAADGSNGLLMSCRTGKTFGAPDLCKRILFSLFYPSHPGGVSVETSLPTPHLKKVARMCEKFGGRKMDHHWQQKPKKAFSA